MKHIEQLPVPVEVYHHLAAHGLRTVEDVRRWLALGECDLHPALEKRLREILEG